MLRSTYVNRNAQSGVALLSVMLLVTVASVLSAQLMQQTSSALIEAGLSEQYRQAYWYSRAGETLGRQILNEDLRDAQNRLQASSDSHHDKWAQRFHDFELDDGMLNITIIDLQSRINLNAMQGKAANSAEAALRALWSQQNLPSAQLEVLIDHLDKHRFHDVSELTALFDFDQRVITELHTLLVALPDSRLAININTANEQVLRALLPNESAQQVRKLIEMRTADAFSSLDQLPLSNYAPSSTKLDVKSEYFEVQAHAQFGKAHHYLRTRLHRTVDGDIRIIDRAEGKQFVRDLLEQTQS